jgi:mRNA degradation ribonuclease J1/J2
VDASVILTWCCFLFARRRGFESIPEPSALVISNPAGAVLPEGDWKLDDRPAVGKTCNGRSLCALRRRPLLAMVCDSTDALVEGSTGSGGICSNQCASWRSRPRGAR